MSKWRTAAQVALWMPVGIAFNSLVVSGSFVKGRSMQPELNAGADSNSIGDFVLLNRFAIQLRNQFNRGDIVVLESPEVPGEYLIKRMIAKEGDFMTDRQGGRHVVPVGHCWIESDGEIASDDSDKFGDVPLALIDSRVSAVLWPPSHVKLVKAHYPTDRVHPLK